MWCAKCQADVAAEVSADNRQVRCATCSGILTTPGGVRTSDSARHARELLERWAHGPLSEATAARTAGPARSTAYRIDVAHPPQGSQSNTAVEPPSQPEPLPPRVHASHEMPAPPPHFDVQAHLTPPPRTNFQAFWGQMLAYGGVLALTIGAAMLLVGYFGGTEWQTYTPTGWLITTIGQMLLLLGVVTLVSGGMEQTTQEVARRIDTLGDRIIRIEWATQHELKGPSIPAERFAGQSEYAPRRDETSRRRSGQTPE